MAFNVDYFNYRFFTNVIKLSAFVIDFACIYICNH